jgi:hypothetical protein
MNEMKEKMRDAKTAAQDRAKIMKEKAAEAAKKAMEKAKSWRSRFGSRSRRTRS